MLNLLKVYQRKLTNLTAANRSLVLLKLTAENDLDFQSLDFTDGKPAYQLLQEIVKGKKEIKLCDYLDSRDKHVNELSKKLNKLHKEDALKSEEPGSCLLYTSDAADDN